MFLELKSNKELYENVLSTLEIELASNQKYLNKLKPIANSNFFFKNFVFVY